MIPAEAGMTTWQWLLNNGIAVAVLFFLGAGMVAVARWMAPRLDSLVKSNLETQKKLQESLDRTEERADLQMVTCKEHVTAVQSTEGKSRANLALWQEACNILREAAPNVIGDETLVADVQRRVDEMERIIREAG